MKILFILNAVRDGRGGTAGIIINLAQSLQAKGQMVDYIFRDDIKFFEKDSRITRIAAYLTFPIVILFLILAKRLYRKYDVIDILSGDGFLYAIISNLFHLKHRARLFMRSAGLEHLFWRGVEEEIKLSRGSSFLMNRLFMLLIRLKEVESFIKNCDWVICINEDEKKYIEEKFRKNSRISYIPNGVLDYFFVPLENRCSDLLFVGDWNIRKGNKYLVRIFLLILDKISDLKLSIAVHNDTEDMILKSFPKNIKDKIRIFRNLYPREMAKLYSSHRIFLFPSIIEGFSAALLEAMAAGMAVIVTSDLACSKIIKNWENGVLVRRRDVDGFSSAAIKLLEDEKLRKNIGMNASRTAKNFTWEKIAEKTLLCYENAVRQ